ncbi:MAG TPA: hypothetical protein VGP82_26195 [Ktedonobacterales bacterium]|nr:hypothetical protein [Ktedonobacterales bacterium]
MPRLGSDFGFTATRHLAIAESRRVVVIIGPRWTWMTDATGLRQLDNPSDVVRRDIDTTLALGKGLWPVLVGGATLPPREELPPSLRPLVALDPMKVRAEGRWRTLRWTLGAY